MFNQDNVSKTIFELRNAITSLRSSSIENINAQALELVLSHALVDLSNSNDLINQLQSQLDELSEAKQLDKQPNEE